MGIYKWYTYITRAAILWSLCFGALRNNITISVSELDQSPSSYYSVRAHLLTLTCYAKTHRSRITLPIGPRCLGFNCELWSVLSPRSIRCCNFILNMDYGWNPNREWLEKQDTKTWVMDSKSYLVCTFYFQIAFYGYLTMEFMTVISYNVSKWNIFRMQVSVNTFG
jgi:hypothetical protein